MTGTHIEFDSDDQHFKLKGKANDLRIDLRELMINGAMSYKPTKKQVSGMEIFMDSDCIPTDPFDMKQWDLYLKKDEKNIKLFEKLILKLDKKLGSVKK